MIYYEVECYFYQYNTGTGDNGNKTKRYRYLNEDEALELAGEINCRIGSDYAHSTFVQHRIDGYFTKPARIFKMTEQEIAVDNSSIQ